MYVTGFFLSFGSRYFLFNPVYFFSEAFCCSCHLCGASSQVLLGSVCCFGIRSHHAVHLCENHVFLDANSLFQMSATSMVRITTVLSCSWPHVSERSQNAEERIMLNSFNFLFIEMYDKLLCTLHTNIWHFMSIQVFLFDSLFPNLLYLTIWLTKVQ